MTQHDIISEVRSRWQDQGIARPPACRSDLARMEAEWRVQLPRVFVALYLQTDGMEEGVSDDLMIRFWPIGEVLPVDVVLEVPESPINHGLFVFADYSLWCHGYAIRLDASESAGAVFLVDGNRPMQVASSFAVFLRNYLEDPRRLFLTSD